nr:ATP-binding protein [Bifidobacterium choloepi]
MPEPGILIESLRDIGYSFESALADIVDNSITAHANDIQIYAVPIEDDDDPFKVAIIDNGEGLDRASLLQAMKLGSTNPREERTMEDLGRFGLGLKTASFSQCRKLTVVSRKDSVTSAFTWDLDVVVRENCWTVIERTDFGNIFAIDQLPEQGTLVLWEKVDRLTGQNGSGKVDYDRVVSDARGHLSLVFHRFLSGEPGLARIEMSLNGIALEPIDPFNTGNSATQASPEEVVCPGVTLRSFTLPHISAYDDKNEYDHFGLPGGYLRNQGVYLYRAKRLIIHGTWFGLTKKTALTQLTRVKIDIGNDRDEEWKIDVKKVSAQLPESVRKRLSNLIQTIGAPSRKVYRRRGTRLTDPNRYPVWTRAVNGDKTVYGINADHPILQAFRSELDLAEQHQFDAIVSLISSMLPTEALFYDIANDADAVSTRTMEDAEFISNTRVFFATLKQFQTEDEALATLRSMEPYSSQWSRTLNALGIEEQ